jgi:hypothetical protein
MLATTAREGGANFDGYQELSYFNLLGGVGTASPGTSSAIFLQSSLQRSLLEQYLSPCNGGHRSMATGSLKLDWRSRSCR